MPFPGYETTVNFCCFLNSTAAVACAKCWIYYFIATWIRTCIAFSSDTNYNWKPASEMAPWPRLDQIRSAMNVIRSSRKWKIIVTGRRLYWLLSILEEILLPEEVATFKTQKPGSCFELSFYSIKSQCISSSVYIPPVYPVYRRPISQPLHLQYKHSAHYVTNKGC